MTTLMVERIARIISKQDGVEAGEAGDFADWHWEEREALARVIIWAMREPSDGMVVAGLRAMGEVELDSIWTAMIDAALAEKAP